MRVDGAEGLRAEGLGVKGQGFVAVKIRSAPQPLRYRLLAASAAAFCLALGLLALSAPQHSSNTELVSTWNPYALEESVPEEADLWGKNGYFLKEFRKLSAHEATKVGEPLQDDERIGDVLARAAQVAFDTVLEVKRAMRGLRGRNQDPFFESKIEVVETMLQHAVKKLGLPSVPPPPPSNRQASLKTAILMARQLRMILSHLPSGMDARDFREARYNLAVYDLDQVSRQINEIMLRLASEPQYIGLTEPKAGDFDQIMHDADEGLETASKAFGAGDNHNKQWEALREISRKNFLPAWKKKQIRIEKEEEERKEVEKEDEKEEKEEKEEEEKEEAKEEAEEKVEEEAEQKKEEEKEAEEKREEVEGEEKEAEQPAEQPAEQARVQAPAVEPPAAKPINFVAPTPSAPQEHIHIDASEAQPPIPPRSRAATWGTDWPGHRAPWPHICVDGQDHDPKHDQGIFCNPKAYQKPAPTPPAPRPLAAKPSQQQMQERLVMQAIAAAVEEDAKAEYKQPLLIPMYRRDEATAVSSAMSQLQKTRAKGKPEPSLNDNLEDKEAVDEDFFRQMRADAARNQDAEDSEADEPEEEGSGAEEAEEAAEQAEDSVAETANGAEGGESEDGGAAGAQGAQSEGLTAEQVNDAEAAEGPRLGQEEEVARAEGAETKAEGPAAQLSSAGVRADGLRTQSLLETSIDGVPTQPLSRSAAKHPKLEMLDSWDWGVGSAARYGLQLEKDAVYQAVKTGMRLELENPERHLAVENAASVAVDAAIRANAGLVAGTQAVEKAAVEGASKAAEEMQMAAAEDSVNGPAKSAIAERVENAAVRAAVLASNGVRRVAIPRPVIGGVSSIRSAAQPLGIPTAQPISVNTQYSFSSNPVAMQSAQPYAMGAQPLSPLAPQVMAQPQMVVTQRLSGSAPQPLSPPAAANSAAQPQSLAGSGTFVPDASQGTPGMVSGTVYYPEQ